MYVYMCVYILFFFTHTLTHTQQNSWTALHWAAASGHEAVAQVLLGAGANINAADEVPTTKTHALLFIIFFRQSLIFWPPPPFCMGEVFFFCV